MKYGITFAYPFAKGQMRSPVLAGIPTQTDVKCRWPDGSIKHAIFSAVIDGNPGQNPQFEIVEGTPVSGAHGAAPPNASVDIKTPIDGASYHWNASDFQPRTWIDGPIASTLIYEDRRSPDQFRPEFITTTFHETGQQDTRVIGANDNANKVAELWIELKITNAGSVYQKTFPMPLASRWSKLYKTTPRFTLGLDLQNLVDARAVPNYAPITVNTGVIPNMYQSWLSSAKDLTDPGNLTKAMGTGGGRPELGPFPSWTALYLYTSDPRLWEQMLGNADLSASWPIHFRQGDGKYYSVDDNPSAQLLNLRGVTVIGDPDNWGWRPDLSHQPSFHYIPYLLTGDPWYLEEMLYWASYSAAYSNGGGMNACCRGPSGKEGYIPGIRCLSMRGQAWAGRNRAQVASICPDDMPEKAYFDRLMQEFIRALEGERSIGDMADPMRAWGKAVNDVSLGNPNNDWELGNGDFVQSPLDWTKSKQAISTWEQNFIRFMLYWARDLGYPTDPLILWSKVNMDATMAVDHRLTATYRTSTVKTNGNPTPFSERPFMYEAGFDLEANWQQQTQNAEHGYGFVAIPAGDLTAMTAPANANNPKWNIPPR